MLRAQSKSPAPKYDKPSGLSRQEKFDHIQLITRKLVTRDSGLAGLLLWIPVALGREDVNALAYTDGKTIFYCDGFFTRPQPEQLAITIHELLHVALRHALRFKQVRLRKGDKFNTDIANICADAIVIRAIKQCPKIGPLDVVNPYIVTAEDIVSPEDLKKTPGPQWTFEMLYNYLEKKVGDAVNKFLSKYKDEKNDDLQPQGCDSPSDTHMDEMETRIWRERVKRASAGTEPGSLLREVLKDLPDSKTPWEKHFRDFLISHVMPTTCVDWSRPSRRLLASKGRLGYYEPGSQRELGVRRAGVVIDTSGSIDEHTVNVFISETNNIMEQTGCEVVLICADADVQSIHHFRERVSGNYSAKGGGGTDFRPALLALEKEEIDCCVYLTDMCGSFPEKAPSFPVMWATMVDQDPPFGRKVVVDVNAA